MSNDNVPNKPASEQASTRPPNPQAGTPEQGTEQEFLEQQQAQALAAVGNTLEELRQSLAQAADVEEWTRRYPWPAVGAAAATGFVAAAALRSLSGSKEEPAQMANGATTTQPQQSTAAAIATAVQPFLSTFAALLAARLEQYLNRPQQPQPTENGEPPASTMPDEHLS